MEFDFARCQRPDGSFYGIADGTQCRKGREAGEREIKEAISSRDREIEFQLGAEFKGKLQRELQLAAKSGMIQSALSSNEADRSIARARLKGEVNSLLKQMEENKVDPNLIKDFVRNRQFLGDIHKSEVIAVGMEDTVPTGLKGATLNKYYAEKLAYHKISKDDPTIKQALTDALAEDSLSYRVSQYGGYQARAITTITKSTVSAIESDRAIGKVAQLELRSLPANRLGSWEAGEMSWVKNSPAISSIIGSRKSYQENDDAMFKNLADQLVSAVKSNPNLKTVTLGTGDDRVNASIIKELERNGAKSHSFIYFARGNPQIGRVVDLDGTGRAFAYDFGLSVSSKEFQHGNVKEVWEHPKNSKGWYDISAKFVEERGRLLAGKAQTYESIVSTKENIIRARDLNRGTGGTSLPQDEARRSAIKTGLLKKALRTREDLTATQQKKLEDEIARREGRATSKDKEAAERNAQREEKRRVREARERERALQPKRNPGRPPKSNQQRAASSDNKVTTTRPKGDEVQRKTAQAILNMHQGKPRAQLKEMLVKMRIPNNIVEELLK